MTTTTQHSPLAPSSAARWVVCPGSVTMEARFPDEPDDDSRNGDAAHWALSEMQHGRTVAEGQPAPNGVLLTAEHLEAVDVALDWIRQSAISESVQIERPVAVPRVHPQCWGTPDRSEWEPGNRPLLIVMDFKYGHRFVPAYENWQLITYAAGLLSATKYSDQDVDVMLVVIQPRCYVTGSPIREWRVPATDLRNYVNRLAMAAEEAMGPNPQCRPNPECRDCRARHACPALQRDAYNSAGLAYSAVPFNLTPQAASLEYKMLTEAAARLDARISGLEVQLIAEAKRGVRLPWQRMVSTAGRETWKPGMDAQVIDLGAMMGVSLARPPEPITPNQARKAGIPETVVAAYAHRPGGALKLEADAGGDAARVFGGTTK